MDIEKAAFQLLQELQEKGYQSYLVGGYVRDKLIGRKINDIDIATNAHPQEIIHIFPNTVPTGMKHGTVTVLFQDFSFEVTTFRKEGKYSDLRHPDEVCFVTTIEEDLARRDFTINAMAMDIEGKIIDPYSGTKDIQQKLIRSVGLPRERFNEDALRMIRAIRFSSQLGFQIEENTWEAIKQLSEQIKHISVERIIVELNKWIDSYYVDEGYKLLVSSKLLQAYPCYEKIFNRKYSSKISSLTLLNDYMERWAALFIISNIKVELAQTILNQLRFSRANRKIILKIITLYQEYKKVETTDTIKQSIWWKKSILQNGFDICDILFHILKVLNLHQHPSDWLQKAYQELNVKNIQELHVNGKDLIQYLDKEPGPWISKILEYLLYKVNFHFIPNTREALLKEARKEMRR